ncbi:MAG TPA: hypothetical protein VML92_05795 [Steroidobacteraceae bacterium]|nr:hypothetical protein [Steroidobacteraceae bacterium]
MPSSSRTRSIVYAAIAGTGLAAASYWLGTIHGADQALAQYRDLAFQTTDDAMRRQLRNDVLLSTGRVDEARRGMGAVAWSHYSTLEDDANGASLPSSEKMREAIAAVRGYVLEYCESAAAGFHSSAQFDICKEHAARIRVPAGTM